MDSPKYFSRNGWNLRAECYGTESWLHNGYEADSFVARFKYGSNRSCMLHYARCITTYFTPKSYFAHKAAGTLEKALSDVGYVHYNILKAKKRGWIK